MKIETFLFLDLNMRHQPLSAKRLTNIAMVAAIYAATSLFALLFLGGLAWGPVQFRISEAICVLALFTPDAIWGLVIGCAVANLINMFLGGLGALGFLDVIFGPLATGLGALFMWHFRKRLGLALLGPVISNALIIPLYLPLLLRGVGFYTIPFTSISLDSSYWLMYFFGVLSIGVGEAVVIYALGLPLALSLRKTPLAKYFQK